MYVYLNIIDSTNEEAKRRIRNKEIIEDSLIVANMQTAGKGTQGKKWSSNPDVGIYMSIIKKSNLALDKIQKATLVAGISVHEILSEYTLKSNLKIKWPNDILLNNKKLCGILTESVKNDATYLIVGIGVNVNNRKFERMNENIPTSLYIETRNYYDRKEIIGKLLKRFNENYEKYIINEEDFIERYKQKSITSREEIESELRKHV